MNKKVVGIGAAVALAALGTLALTTYVGGAADRARAGEDLVDVFVVDEPVKAGTGVSELAKSVRAEQVPAKVRASDAVVSFKALEGLVVSVDLVPGEQLLQSRFVNPATSQVARSALTNIPEGLLEVTVELDPERALGGDLRAGDTVGVVASFERKDSADAGATADPAAAGGTPSTTSLTLHKILVTKVKAEAASTTTKSGDLRAVQAPPTGKVYVTLAVDPGTLERLVYCVEFGRIWLSYEPREAPESGTRIVTRSNVYAGTGA